ncbi:MAG TPA: zf-HC2 domain-containing protein [Acidimicrobiia bacterium]
MSDVHDDALDPDMLSAYLDGELIDAERAEVDAQLQSSPSWREELVEVRAARDALRGLSARDAPAGFWDAVHAYVAADADEEVIDDEVVVVPITAAPSHPRRRWAWIAASAAAVAAVVAIVVMPHRTEVSPNVAAVVAQHGAQGSDNGDPVSMLAPVGPLAGFRR